MRNEPEAGQHGAVPLLPARVFGLLAYVEVAAIIAALVVCGVRLIFFGIETQGRFHGMLQLLDQHWRGALILGSLLFFRTLHLALARSAAFYNMFKEPRAGTAVTGLKLPPPAKPQSKSGPP